MAKQKCDIDGSEPFELSAHAIDTKALPSLASELTPSRLLQETWESYLAARDSGTPTQRSAALKAVYDQVLAQTKDQVDQRQLNRFQLMDDKELKAEVLRLLRLVAEDLGLGEAGIAHLVMPLPGAEQ